MTYSPLDIKLFELFSPNQKELTSWMIIKDEHGFFQKYLMSIHKWKTLWAYTKWIGFNATYQIPTSQIKEILWHEPTITDVFRVAKEKWWTPQIKYGLVTQVNEWEKVGSYLGYFLWIELNNGERVPQFNTLTKSDYSNMKYNPTLPLLQQSEETKTELIKLFS